MEGQLTGTRKYDTPTVARMITGGEAAGIAGDYLRQWFREGLVESRQREKNAKIWYSTKGVLQAWELWAGVKGYDPEGDMPEAVRKLSLETRSSHETPTSSLDEGVETPELVVKILVPPGVSVQVIQAQ
jgi:hypothetical protein